MPSLVVIGTKTKEEAWGGGGLYFTKIDQPEYG